MAEETGKPLCLQCPPHLKSKLLLIASAFARQIGFRWVAWQVGLTSYPSNLDFLIAGFLGDILEPGKKASVSGEGEIVFQL